MHRALPNQDSHPLLDSAQSRAAEVAAMAHLPPHELMRRAGLAVAKLALALTPSGGSIGIACGPGNNGGDGLLAAALLRSAGRTVHVRYIPAVKPPPADAAWAREQAQSAGVALLDDGSGLPADCCLIIDALLGLGLKREPDTAIAALMADIGRHAAPVLAVDVPSGLCSDTGALAGGATLGRVVHAAHTLTLLSLKPGLFTGQGRGCAGEIWFDDLGVAPVSGSAALLSSEQLMRRWRHLPQHDTHKGTQGDVLVVGGAAGMRGAALLAARAALGAGAGRVYACLLGQQNQDLDAQRPELMHWSEARLQSHADCADKVIVAGCGGGNAIGAHLPILLHHARRLVLDADALNVIAADTSLQARLPQRSARGLHTVLTPHPLEAARLLGISSAEVQHDRLASVKQLALTLQCTVVLKGSGTLIASPNACPWINPTGNGSLATAGTGDVLAGWLGGLWAQMPNELAQRIAASAVYWHGLAADQSPGEPLRAADLVERMHALHRQPAA